MTEIRIYFEGNPKLRPGLDRFLDELRAKARELRLGWQSVACGDRWAALRDFETALSSHPDAFNVLLVDAEDVVPSGQDPIDHLRQRDTWQPPTGIDSKQVHLMVAVMEAWFLADKQALADYYGQEFHVNSLPQNPQVERIPKADIEHGLKQATRHTKKGPYHKTRHAPALLETIDPDLVKQSAPHCQRLFEVLSAVLEIE